jgi:PAS domain S-box-containing protein
MEGDLSKGTVINDPAVVLSIAIQAANLGVWEWDLRSNEFRYSERAKVIFGLPLGKPVSREQIIAVLHPDDHQVARDQAIRSMDPSVHEREPFLYRVFRASDGELRWIRAFGEPVFETVEDEPVAVSYIGTLQDVTEEILAKQELLEKEARLRLAIEASGIAVWEVNLADQTITHSPELNRLCGFEPDARPTLEEFRSRYAPGERERLEKEGAEARARGETSYQSEIRYLWPDGTEKWLMLRAQVAPGETGYGGRVIGTLVDITERKNREERQALLLAELKHRIKNSFAVTQSIIGQTLAGEDISDATRSKLFARLQAMAEAHDVIAGGAWEGASLMTVLRRSMKAFEVGSGRRIDVEGSEFNLSPRAALSFSLVLHELFTNAAKYGSLSNETGRIHIKIDRETNGEPHRLRLSWTEVGGPPVKEVTRAGFGTRLMERVVKAELEAEVRREFRQEGLSLVLNVPLKNLGGPPDPAAMHQDGAPTAEQSQLRF